MQRTQVWFLEAVKQSGFDLYERTIAMLEAALHHKSEAESRIEMAYSPVKKNNENENMSYLPSNHTNRDL